MLDLRRYLNVVYALLVDKTRGEAGLTEAIGAIDKVIAPPAEQPRIQARENAAAMEALGAMLAGVGVPGGG